MSEPLVYRPAQVAELLQVSRAAVYRGIAGRTIPAVRFGRSVRIPRWWVDEQLARRVA
jgi:excisionase family DNA binding protein